MGETTNIFLLYLQYCTGWNRELKKSRPRLYCVNGACLWFSFVPCRLLLFPTWLPLVFRLGRTAEGICVLRHVLVRWRHRVSIRPLRDLVSQHHAGLDEGSGD